MGTVAGFDFAVVIATGGVDAFDGRPGAGRGSVRFGLPSGIVLLSGGEPPRPTAVERPASAAGLVFTATSNAFHISPTCA
jgi:hypothetical protein